MNMSTPMSPKPLVNATCKLGMKGCFEDGRCHALGNCEHKIVTNADRIRAEDDDEIKTEIHAFSLGFKPWCDYHCENEGDDGCDNCIEAWLQQPAEVSRDGNRKAAD